MTISVVVLISWPLSTLWGTGAIPEWTTYAAHCIFLNDSMTVKVMVSIGSYDLKWAPNHCRDPVCCIFTYGSLK